jgi:heat shock protein HtpX
VSRSSWLTARPGNFVSHDDGARCGVRVGGQSQSTQENDRAEAQHADAIGKLRRRLAREKHSHHSQKVMSGLLDLLDLCSKATGLSRGGRHALTAIQSKLHVAERQPRETLRALGARPLHCAEAPHLYAILLNICVRAGMRRAPELFLLPFPGMNAYALGTPANSCISVTEGLLHHLSQQEIAGIFAHEVAHIIHHDTGGMSLAAAVQGEIANSAMRGMVELTARRNDWHGKDWDESRPMAMLLAAAPALARLLFLALSRIRELAADAMALDLIDHPRALADALCKLEYFHSGLTPFHAHLQDHPDALPLRSHPGTWERLSHLA